MIAQIVGCIALGWLLGMGTAIWIGGRITAQQKKIKRIAQREVLRDATGLALDDEIIEAIERQIARCKRAAEQVKAAEPSTTEADHAAT